MESQFSTILKDRFGFDSFREQQLEIIRHVSIGHDAVVIMPTGMQIPLLSASRPRQGLHDCGLSVAGTDEGSGGCACGKGNKGDPDQLIDLRLENDLAPI